MIRANLRYLMLFLALIPPPALAADELEDIMRGDVGSDNEFTDHSKPWTEFAIEIPPPPLEKDLLQIPIDMLSDAFSVYIDQRNLSVGEDQVVRYWLVVRSDRGANNVFYEGIRCGQRQYKNYAFASMNGKGKLRKVRKPKWLDIYSGTDFRGEVLEYLCNDVTPRKPERIIAAIKGSSIPISHIFDPDIGPFQQ